MCIHPRPSPVSKPPLPIPYGLHVPTPALDHHPAYHTTSPASIQLRGRCTAVPKVLSRGREAPTCEHNIPLGMHAPAACCRRECLARRVREEEQVRCGCDALAARAAREGITLARFWGDIEVEIRGRFPPLPISPLVWTKVLCRMCFVKPAGTPLSLEAHRGEAIVVECSRNRTKWITSPRKPVCLACRPSCHAQHDSRHPS